MTPVRKILIAAYIVFIIIYIIQYLFYGKSLVSFIFGFTTMILMILVMTLYKGNIK
ncbi:hypothetical protein SAMN05444484_102822 [Flavobacterium chilense]|uniref:Uncharacterized protein n=1 Tax=Flavobacterium chilense TaxID=946677 RepID=A0A1M7E1Y6_9FLAO|nr:hypothetical protein SAMN05444484_102822 [Flavobacterium chilense]